ncbi:MAG: hypothetical protein AB9921_03600 [Erysipelotrichaceae bacterium]
MRKASISQERKHMFKEIKYNKLIRDRIPEIIETSGKSHEIMELDHDAFLIELKKKLVEESREVVSSETKEEMINELVDVCEIVEKLMDVYGISQKELDDKKEIKRQTNGGFNKQLFLISVTEKSDY